MSSPASSKDPSSVREGRLVLGLQPVREALRVHGGSVRRLLVQTGEHPRLDALERFAKDQGVSAERVPKGRLDKIAEGGMHQGVLAWAPELRLTPFEDLLKVEHLLAIALDGIQDPQNFGAVVRSAVALGNVPIIWGEHASAPLTPATFRASAGAVEHATLCRVRSLHGALGEATAQGVQVIGLDAQAPQALYQLPLVEPTILVVGNEHEGMKRAVRRACSALARLVAAGPVDSLNASVAAGTALYEALVQRAKTNT